MRERLQGNGELNVDYSPGKRNVGMRWRRLWKHTAIRDSQAAGWSTSIPYPPAKTQTTEAEFAALG